MAQTYPNLEMVLVNDGAPLRSLDARIRVLNLPKSSVGQKRNAGLQAARGVYIATWDDDDVSFPERVARYVALAERTGADAVRSGHMWIADAGMTLRGLVSGSCYATALIRRASALRVSGYPDISYREDMWLWTKFKLHGLKLLVDEAPLYVARRHALNVSRTHGNDHGVMSMHGNVDVSAADMAATDAYVQALRAAPIAQLVTAA